MFANWLKFKNSCITYIEQDVHPHVSREKAEYFSAFDGCSTEIEYLELLMSLVRTHKPTRCFESGSFKGFGTIAIAYALQENSKSNCIGHLDTVDSCVRNIKNLELLVQENSLDDFVSCHSQNSLAFIDSLKGSPTPLYDIVFFDSSRIDRIKEYKLLNKQKLLKPNCLLIFHDTSKNRADGSDDPNQRLRQSTYLENIDKIQEEHGNGIDLSLSRGLRIIKYSN